MDSSPPVAPRRAVLVVPLSVPPPPPFSFAIDRSSTGVGFANVNESSEPESRLRLLPFTESEEPEDAEPSAAGMALDAAAAVDRLGSDAGTSLVAANWKWKEGTALVIFEGNKPEVAEGLDVDVEIDGLDKLVVATIVSEALDAGAEAEADTMPWW